VGLNSSALLLELYSSLRASTGQDENRKSARCFGRIDVSQGIADERDASQGYAILPAEIPEQSWFRLSAFTVVVRMMGTKCNSAQVAACTPDCLLELPVYRFERRAIKKLAGNAGLIGSNSHGVACPRKTSNRLYGAFVRYELVRGSYVFVRVAINDAITVQDY